MSEIQFSPVKQEIADLLLSGLTKETVVSIIAKKRKVKSTQRAYGTFKSYVTMVENTLNNIKKEAVIKVKKEKSVHDFSKGDGKQRLRTRLIEEMKYSLLKNGIVLTLSSNQCILESLINKDADFKTLKFLSCECDEVIFPLLQDNIKKNNLTFMEAPLPCKIGIIIRLAGRDKFSHLFLDYCQTLQKFEEEIAIALENKIVVEGGLVWITVSTRSGQVTTKTELDKLIKKHGGSDYKVECSYSYRDTVTMHSVIIRRIK
jgi:hypothetical protein